MRILKVAALGVIGFVALACGPGPSEPLLPIQPSPVVTEPPPDPPPPPPPGARRIELSSVIRDELRQPPPAGCPATERADIFLPCRHFEVAAPADGILRVEVDWRPRHGAEGVMLIIAGVNNPNQRLCCDDPQIGWHRVLAGSTYGITVAYWPSHFDLIWGGGPDLLGEFTLNATFQR